MTTTNPINSQIEELNKLSYYIMESLINNEEARKKFQKYMDLTSKDFQKGKQEGFKEGEHHALNSFFLWLDWLIRTPKMSWKEQIKTKAKQIFIELNKKEKQDER